MGRVFETLLFAGIYSFAGYVVGTFVYLFGLMLWHHDSLLAVLLGLIYFPGAALFLGAFEWVGTKHIWGMATGKEALV